MEKLSGDGCPELALPALGSFLFSPRALPDRIKAPGKYSFRLLSDDGSALYIDERRIIDNDCMHLPMSVGGSVRLEGGIHDLRVSYFQGPRWQVALVLEVKPPGDNWLTPQSQV